jgi:hypothetical protein
MERRGELRLAGLATEESAVTGPATLSALSGPATLFALSFLRPAHAMSDISDIVTIAKYGVFFIRTSLSSEDVARVPAVIVPSWDAPLLGAASLRKDT